MCKVFNIVLSWFVLSPLSNLLVSLFCFAIRGIVLFQNISFLSSIASFTVSFHQMVLLFHHFTTFFIPHLSHINGTGILKVRCQIWQIQLALAGLTMQIGLKRTLRWNEWYGKTNGQHQWDGWRIEDWFGHHIIHEVLQYRKFSADGYQIISPPIWKNVH